MTASSSVVHIRRVNIKEGILCFLTSLPGILEIWAHRSTFRWAARCSRYPHENICISHPTQISGSHLQISRRSSWQNSLPLALRGNTDHGFRPYPPDLLFMLDRPRWVGGSSTYLGESPCQGEQFSLSQGGVGYSVQGRSSSPWPGEGRGGSPCLRWKIRSGDSWTDPTPPSQPVNIRTDTSEDITFPLTPYVVGKNNFSMSFLSDGIFCQITQTTRTNITLQLTVYCNAWSKRPWVWVYDYLLFHQINKFIYELSFITDIRHIQIRDSRSF